MVRYDEICLDTRVSEIIPRGVWHVGGDKPGDDPKPHTSQDPSRGGASAMPSVLFPMGLSRAAASGQKRVCRGRVFGITFMVMV